MILYNYSDMELRIINNAMNEFCNELREINFQLMFYCSKDFLENIFNRVSITLNARRFFKYSNSDDLILSYNFNAHEIKMVLKILRDIFMYMHDISHNGKNNIATYQFKLTQKKLKELFSQLPSGNLSDNEVILMNYFLNEFFQELRLILSKTQGQEFLDNILCDMQHILENKSVIYAWATDDLMLRLSLNQDQVTVLIKALKILPRYFKDVEVDTMIGGSFLEIDALISKLEHWQFSMKFNVISDEDLNFIYNFINELIDESHDIDYKNLFSCHKQFLENILSKIIIIMDNRIFFKKWNDYNPLEVSSLDEYEINVVIKMLERKHQYFNNEDIYKNFGYSSKDVEELKNKLEALLV